MSSDTSQTASQPTFTHGIKIIVHHKWHCGNKEENIPSQRTIEMRCLRKTELQHKDTGKCCEKEKHGWQRIEADSSTRAPLNAADDKEHTRKTACVGNKVPAPPSIEQLMMC